MDLELCQQQLAFSEYNLKEYQGRSTEPLSNTGRRTWMSISIHIFFEAARNLLVSAGHWSVMLSLSIPNIIYHIHGTGAKLSMSLWAWVQPCCSAHTREIKWFIPHWCGVYIYPATLSFMPLKINRLLMWIVHILPWLFYSSWGSKFVFHLKETSQWKYYLKDGNDPTPVL